jgi:hypothetical protein
MVQMKRRSISPPLRIINTWARSASPTIHGQVEQAADRTTADRQSKDDIQKVYLFLATTILKNEPIKELITPEVAGSVWRRVADTADTFYKPGTFTTFAAYEWSSTPDNRNLHRNVIFKDSKKTPIVPFSAIDSTQPEDLWTWMDGQRKAGNRLLAISHNANLSDGAMFPLEVDGKGRPIDAAWAQSR